ncbi:hypothetical protein N4R57_05675 [Rhodobacteraceae bacterium D3-12]|nr:hypothetical protein N4R57_05675 [Rhodobacteraceae bacterium D3-12]
MENRKIFHIGELAINANDKNKIPDEELAFIATLSFAVDEAAVFKKLLIQTFTDKPKDDDSIQLFMINQFTIMRALNAKIFESLRIFEDYKTILTRSVQKDRADFLSRFDSEYQKIVNDKAYELARTIRNNSTNHYLQSITRSNLPHVSENSVLKMYLHKSVGNSFHPLGEEYVFIAGVAREHGGRNEVISALEGWIDWGIMASKLVTRLHQDYLVWLHKSHFPEWKLRKKTPYLDEKFVKKIGTATLPLVLLED